MEQSGAAISVVNGEWRLMGCGLKQWNRPNKLNLGHPIGTAYWFIEGQFQGRI